MRWYVNRHRHPSSRHIVCFPRPGLPLRALGSSESRRRMDGCRIFLERRTDICSSSKDVHVANGSSRSAPAMAVVSSAAVTSAGCFVFSAVSWWNDERTFVRRPRTHTWRTVVPEAHRLWPWCLPLLWLLPAVLILMLARRTGSVLEQRPHLVPGRSVG